MRSLLLPLLLSASTTIGCASVMSGTSQRVRIDTHPGAKTLVDGRTFVGSNSIELPRRGPHVLRVEKSGYEGRSVNVSSRMNGWVWGNLALGPLFPIGVVIDALTGAIHDLSPRTVHVELEAEAPAPKPAPKPEVAIRTPSPAPMPPPPVYSNWILAVMEMQRLRGEEPADDVLRALSEQLRVRLAADRWRVIDRTSQEGSWAEIVEAEKHRSYRNCHDPSCQIPLGRALAATHVLRTSVARFGQRCVFGAELYELETEVSIAAGTSEGACDEESLLETAHKLLKDMGDSATLAPRGPG